MYNQNNIFAKILRKELPADIIYENEHVLAFNDINPEHAIHILVIPKKPYTNYQKFIELASDIEISSFFKTIGAIAAKLDVVDNYKLITNNGPNAGQIVEHFHMHLLSGKPLKI